MEDNLKFGAASDKEKHRTVGANKLELAQELDSLQTTIFTSNISKFFLKIHSKFISNCRENKLLAA